ncbi:MAG: hypothetical protein ACI9CD_000639 [Candidatus Deianiraeaceae bacterium]|jgi:hypothetical protein
MLHTYIYSNEYKSDLYAGENFFDKKRLLIKKGTRIYDSHKDLCGVWEHYIRLSTNDEGYSLLLNLSKNEKIPPEINGCGELSLKNGFQNYMENRLGSQCGVDSYRGKYGHHNKGLLKDKKASVISYTLECGMLFALIKFD